MSEEFTLDDMNDVVTPKPLAKLNWHICILCQEVKLEPHQWPDASKKDMMNQKGCLEVVIFRVLIMMRTF